jgi:hypothetical protein
MNKLTIELGGKERTLKFDMRAQEKLEKLLMERLDAEEIVSMAENAMSDGTNMFSTAILIYAAMLSYCAIVGSKPDFTLEDCIDWYEEIIHKNESQKIQAIMDVYTESTAYKSRVELKKNLTQAEQTGMKSEDTHSEKSESGQENITS